jgi:hypothetical protein
MIGFTSHQLLVLVALLGAMLTGPAAVVNSQSANGCACSCMVPSNGTSTSNTTTSGSTGGASTATTCVPPFRTAYTDESECQKACLTACPDSASTVVGTLKCSNVTSNGTLPDPSLSNTNSTSTPNGGGSNSSGTKGSSAAAAASGRFAFVAAAATMAASVAVAAGGW